MTPTPRAFPPPGRARLPGLLLLWLLAAPTSAAGQAEGAPGPPAPAPNPAPSEGELRVLDVPYVPQSPELCGGAAAAMVLRYWGRSDVEAGSFSHLVRPVPGGIRTDDLAAELRSRGWRTLRPRPDTAAVRRHVRAGRPVILLLEVGPDRFHYVVAVAAPDGEWLIHDPARAPFRRLSTAELTARWRPADRWSLLALPHEPGGGDPADRAVDDLADRAVDAPTGGAVDGAGDTAGAALERDGPPGEAAVPDGGGADRAGSCGAAVRRGVGAARRGSAARADSLLRRAAAGCPRAAAPRRELAGLRFRQERWAAARRRAREALERAPDDSLAARILASASFVEGREREALAAWNRLGEPRLSAVRVYGLRRTRYRPLRRQMGLEPGGTLTPGDLALARRRVEAVPAFASSRVGLAAPEDGRVALEAAVLERPLVPSSAPALAAVALRGLVEREARVSAASIAGSGGRATATWRWWSGRPRAGIRVRAPGAFGVPGVWTVTGAWERPSFARPEPPEGTEPGDGNGSPGSGSAGDPSGSDVLREERRGGGVALSRWVTPSLRLQGSVGVDRWSGPGSRVRVSGEVGARGLDGRLAARLTLGGWTGGGRDFGRAGLEAALRTEPSTGPGLRLEAALAAADPAGPRTLWAGAGTGHARRPLLRAHPLLRDGVVRGPAFGPRLAQVTLEARWTPATGLPFRVAAAGFLDAAAAGGAVRPDRGFLDGGLGLRIGLPGVGGELRVDAARGLTDGAEAVSVGWRPPWPGW